MQIDIESGKINKVNIQEKFKDGKQENERYYGVKMDQNSYLLKAEYDQEKGMLSKDKELSLALL